MPRRCPARATRPPRRDEDGPVGVDREPLGGVAEDDEGRVRLGLVGGPRHRRGVVVVDELRGRPVRAGELVADPAQTDQREHDQRGDDCFGSDDLAHVSQGCLPVGLATPVRPVGCLGGGTAAGPVDERDDPVRDSPLAEFDDGGDHRDGPDRVGEAGLGKEEPDGGRPAPSTRWRVPSRPTAATIGTTAPVGPHSRSR
ncbi:hypothetical protein ACFQER_05545 [Halomicroarcula sp. GCM10025894]|uniref:hypothetical protein n=1 Tax=Halomicroarcula sp. GCM10025894 TaxID=3252673 RepID=UPI00361D194C